MPDDPCQALRTRLGETLPDRLWTLPEDQLADLVDALDEAHARQAAALDHSIDRALRFIPWPLRVVVRSGRLAAPAGRLPAVQRAEVLDRARALRLIRKLGPVAAALAQSPAPAA